MNKCGSGSVSLGRWTSRTSTCPNSLSVLRSTYTGSPPSPAAFSHLRSLGYVFGAVADEADGLHAGVGEGGVAGELRQTLHRILKGVDGGGEVPLEHVR